MHKLDRASSVPPVCLSFYDYQTQSWSDLAPLCKRELRAALVRMQGIPEVTTPDANEYGLRCAYCEGTIFHEGHIEHFRRKNPAHYPQLTFVWGNLFLACGATSHCGHYKDRRIVGLYKADDLLKPDEDDPSEFLFFHSTGEIRIKAGISAADTHRAQETIRVFGLNAPELVGARKKALKSYKEKVLSDLDELASWPLDDQRDYLMTEVEATRWDPYSTTIHHFLQSRF